MVSDSEDESGYAFMSAEDFVVDSSVAVAVSVGDEIERVRLDRGHFDLGAVGPVQISVTGDFFAVEKDHLWSVQESGPDGSVEWRAAFEYRSQAERWLVDRTIGRLTGLEEDGEPGFLCHSDDVVTESDDGGDGEDWGDTELAPIPMVACASHGGVYEDDSFLAGIVFGTLVTSLKPGSNRVGHCMVPPELLEQVDLLAMQRGYVMKAHECSDPEVPWVHVDLIPGSEVET